jgi:hypothetical protein
MTSVCSTQGEKRNPYRIFQKQRDHYEDPDVKMKIIFKRIVEKLDRVYRMDSSGS